MCRNSRVAAKLKACVVFVVVIAAACGGGGDKPPGPEDPTGVGRTTGGAGWITITTPQPSPFSTESTSVDLGGAAFVSPVKAVCCSAPITGVTVSWSTTAGGRGAASQSAFLCGPFGFLAAPDHVCNHTWTANVPLVMGANTIDVLATDFAGNSAIATITVTRVPETVPPTVSATYPVRFASNAAVNSAITVTFSEQMDPTTINSGSFLLHDGSGSAVNGRVSITGVTALFEPTSFLAGFTTYTATVTTDAKDLAGNPLRSSFSWTFDTGNADFTRPSVVSFFPPAGGSCAAVDEDITVVFSEPVTNLGLGAITLKDETTGNDINGASQDFGSFAATFRTVSPMLTPSHTYTGTVSNQVTDLAGNALFRTSWTFDTPPDGPGMWSPLASVPGGSPPDGVLSDTSLVWTGTELITFGGYGVIFPGFTGPLDRGSRYAASSQTWTTLPVGPSARYGHIAVWTGTEMIVWGGKGPYGALLNDGARYNAQTNTWSSLNSSGAPSPSDGATGVWTGQEVLVWGAAGGGAYNPTTDTWRRISDVGAPASRVGHTAVWTGDRMIIWGGTRTACPPSCSNAGGAIYDPLADAWSAISSINEPTSQVGHSAVWTGTEMAVWAGKSGGLYDPFTGVWRAIPVTCGPAARGQHTAVWTGTELIIWGGNGGGRARRTGARYNPATGAWQHISLANSPESANGAKSVWTGREMVIFPTGSLYVAVYSP